MPNLSYAVDPGGPRRVELTWEEEWKDLRVRFDGAQVATADGKDALARGLDCRLSDDSLLRLELKGDDPSLRVLRDGVPVPGSPGDPRSSIRNGVLALGFAAGLWLLAVAGGVMHVSGVSPHLPKLAVVSGVLVILAWWASRGGVWPFGLGLAYFLYDLVVAVTFMVQAHLHGRPIDFSAGTLVDLALVWFVGDAAVQAQRMRMAVRAARHRPSLPK